MVMVSRSQPAISFHLRNGETTLQLRLLTWEYLPLLCVVSTYVVLQGRRIIVCGLRRSCIVTEPGSSVDMVWTFHIHGTNDMQLAARQFIGICNRIPRN